MSIFAEYLQSKFECKKCGKCCSQGGDMALSWTDVASILGYLDLSGGDVSCYFAIDYDSVYGYARMKEQCPCQFMDKLDKTCTVQDAKPQACKDYPFLLYERGGCTLDAVLVCPEARLLLEDLLQGGL